jgi:Dehydrogenases with different specificities (related to short-chain alcohol dehydrogenases)
MKLEGKVAIVTGSTAGIGKGIALMFAKEGAKICVVGRNAQRGAEVVQMIKDLRSDAIFVQADVAEKEETLKYINRTIDAFGEINILVNNAALIHQSRVLDLEEDDWDRIIKTNLRSVFLGSKYAATQMVKQGKGGRIINLSSIHAKISEPQAAPYTAAKGGIEAFTRTLATELAPYKITANILAPGATYTELTIPMYTPSVKEALFKRIPLKEIANPEDIACGALFLASDESWYMTGSRLCIDGGYEMDGSLPDAEYWTE